MFTGIVEATATVRSHATRNEITTMRIETPDTWDISLGQSIAVNGVCLSASALDEKTFTVEMMQETLSKTIFGSTIPDVVNLERAMLATDRFEGHVVQGHVDTVGTIVTVHKEEETMQFVVSFDARFAPLVVEKGSISINGVSLTIVEVTKTTLSVALIPHTLAKTTLGDLEEDSLVNLEFDIIGKYITNKLVTT